MSAVQGGGWRGVCCLWVSTTTPWGLPGVRRVLFADGDAAWGLLLRRWVMCV